MIMQHVSMVVVCVAGCCFAQTKENTREIEIGGEKLRYLAFEPADPTGAAIFVGLPPGDQSEKLGRLAFESYWKSMPESGWVVLIPLIGEHSNGSQIESTLLEGFFDALPSLYGERGAKPHLAGVSSGGRSAYRIATSRSPGRLSSLVLMPGCATTDTELKSAVALKDLHVRMFLGGEEDASWTSATESTFRALRDANAEVKLIIRENEGHMLRITPAEFRNIMDELKAIGAPAPGEAMAREAAVGAVLDDFHLAASQADGARYFAHFAPNGIFLGTDGSERWSVDQFRAYATPFFAQGKGWTYIVKTRHLTTTDDGQYAWFDEVLENDKYGECRGTGVLVKSSDGWKIAQYNLTVPIPNDLLADVARDIRSKKQEK